MLAVALLCRRPSRFLTQKAAQSHVCTQNAPGPGAYEQRSTLGKSKMFTARGRGVLPYVILWPCLFMHGSSARRQASSYMRSRSQPGPHMYIDDCC